MRKFLLFGLCLGGAVLAAGAGNSQHFRCFEKDGLRGKVMTERNSGVDVRSRSGKGIVSPTALAGKGKLSPTGFASKPGSKETPRCSNAAVLFESFENSSAERDSAWLPEGWTMLSNGDEALTASEKWMNIGKVDGYPAPTDGNFEMFINYASVAQDEWLVSPAVTIPSEMYQLTFDMWIDPVWFFDTSYINWETSEYTEQVVIQDYQVMVREGAEGEWTLLHSYADDYKGLTFDQLMALAPGELTPCRLSLADYAGKEIQIAFRYMATDGNFTALDNVRIALPKMELSMAAPLSTLYYGISKDLTALNMSLAIYPALTPISFENTTGEDAFQYSWRYSDPETAEYVDTDDATLTVSYRPDYTSEFTCRNNLYYPPILRASAPGFSDGEAKMPVDYIQAGGKAQWQLKDLSTNEEYIGEMGMLPFDLNTAGLSFASDDADFGEKVTPIFGHNKNTTAYWTEYTFHGEGEEGDNAQVQAILNYIYPADSPMVLDGCWLTAVGQVKDGGQLTAEIIPLVPAYDGEEFIGYTLAETPLASAACKTEEILGRQDDGNGYLTCPFAFDAPLVIDKSSDAYMVKISGFNDDDHFTYFAPLQGWKPRTDFACYGWIEKAITYQGETNTSLSPMCYYENDYGQMYSAFAINLDASFPWLTAEEESVEMGDEAAQVKLGSYYDGADMTVEAPEWLEATAAGRYGDCVLTLKGKDIAQEDREGVVAVTAPGVKQEIAVKQAASGVTEIEADGVAGMKAVYTADGKRVDGRQLQPGLYIVVTADGRARKAIVR